MGSKNSSFHMSNEFNGYGQKTYLSATQYNTYPALSQENIRLTPDFGSLIANVLGSQAVLINANSGNDILLKNLGGMSSANQIMIGKDAKTGQYLFSYSVSASNEFTNDSYLLAASNSSAMPVLEIAPYGWVTFGTSGWKWGEERGNYYRKEGWLQYNGKWYYFSDYWMQTKWKKIVYEGKAQWFYFFSEKDSSGIEKYGHMVTGWIELLYNGKMHWFYFHGKGTMAVSEWISYKGKWYFQRSDGTMQKSSLREWRGKLYYLKEDGSMAVSETIIDADSGKTYYADGDGVCTQNDSLRDKIINAAEWYLNGCGSDVYAQYSMNYRGKKPDGAIDKTLQPWQAYTYLDCSAYVGVVYTSAGIAGFDGNGDAPYINTSTLRVSTRTYKIKKAELLPGDLVFRNNGSTNGANHVGIFAYFNENNQIVAYDCASGVNKIQKIARPTIWESNDSLYYRYIGF